MVASQLRLARSVVEGPAVVLHSSWCGFALPSCPQSFSQHHCWGLAQCLTRELRIPHGKHKTRGSSSQREGCRSGAGAGAPQVGPCCPMRKQGAWERPATGPPPAPRTHWRSKEHSEGTGATLREAAGALSQKPRPPMSPARAPGARKQGGGGHKWLHSPPPPVTHRETVCSSSPNVGPFGVAGPSRSH